LPLLEVACLRGSIVSCNAGVPVSATVSSIVTGTGPGSAVTLLGIVNVGLAALVSEKHASVTSIGPEITDHV
jgi:hypothetical protein